MTFSSHRTNVCTCGHEVPPVNDWSSDELPYATCAGCGLHYVLEWGQIMVYETGTPEELAQFVERGELLAAGMAAGPDAPEPNLNHLAKVA